MSNTAMSNPMSTATNNTKTEAVVSQHKTLVEQMDSGRKTALTQTALVGLPAAVGHFEHVQSLASDAWVVNHNFGFKPVVTVLSIGGVEMLAEFIHTSVNQVVVYFDQPLKGLVICK